MLLGVLIQAIFIFVLATFVFDCIHFLLHKFSKAKISVIKDLGHLHDYHHQFFDEKLITHNNLWKSNLKYHLIPELLTQLTVTSICFLFADWLAVVLVLIFEILIFLLVIFKKGRDFNHTFSLKAPKRAQMLWFVMPSYHYKHHLDTENYFSSWYRFFDLIFGFSASLRQKTFLVTGSSGAFGSELTRKFDKAGIAWVPIKWGEDFSKDHYSHFREKTKQADGLILCHGSKDDCQWSLNESYQTMIELFLENTKSDLPEIWALGSEIEFHPALMQKDTAYEIAKRDFAHYAANIYRREDILYRHIVPSAFRSPFGPAPISSKPFVWILLFLVKRGFRYIPLTYTGIALLNFFKFRRL